MSSTTYEDVQEIKPMKAKTNSENACYPIAIKGSAVVPCPFSCTRDELQTLCVLVGNTGNEPTIWSSADDPEVSNYECLIGYRSLHSQHAGFQKLLKGSIQEARNELLRCFREEVVVARRPMKNSNLLDGLHRSAL
jgi:hypothetical protein